MLTVHLRGSGSGSGGAAAAAQADQAGMHQTSSRSLASAGLQHGTARHISQLICYVTGMLLCSGKTQAGQQQTVKAVEHSSTQVRSRGSLHSAGRA